MVFLNFQSGPARIFCKLFTLSYFISCDIMKNFHISIPIQLTSKTISTFFCVLCHSRIFKHTWRLRLIKISLIVKNILALKGIPTIVNRIHWSLQEMSPRTTVATAVFTPFRQAVMTLIVLRP